MPNLQEDFNNDHARIWRTEIVKARIRLADGDLSRSQRATLWRIVDFREWCLKTTVPDFEAELERIDREIERALRKSAKQMA